MQPKGARSGDVGYDQLHHFVAAEVWDSIPLEAALLKEAAHLFGDRAGFPVSDDTALPKSLRWCDAKRFMWQCGQCDEEHNLATGMLAIVGG